MLQSLTLEIPKDLLDLVRKRALLRGVGLSSEFRYLIELGLGYTQADVWVPIKGPVVWVTTTIHIQVEIRDILKDRAKSFHRSLGKEVVRVVTYALEETARADLAVITEMMRHRAPEAQPVR